MVLEQDGYELDQSCETLKRIAKCHGGENPLA
jgi:hypothetical protein